MYSLPLMCMTWAAIGVVAGWMYATHKDYPPERDPYGRMVANKAPQKPVSACTDRWVGVAKVPVWNTVSLAAVGSNQGVVGSTIVRTLVKRHAITGRQHYIDDPVTVRELRELVHA